MYKAKYYNRVTHAIYWRTVYANSMNRAIVKADRLANKGFICTLIKTIPFKD